MRHAGRATEIVRKAAQQLRYKIMGASPFLHVWEAEEHDCGYWLQVFTQTVSSDDDMAGGKPAFMLGGLFCSVTLHIHEPREGCKFKLGDATIRTILGEMPFTMTHPEFFDNVANHIAGLLKKGRNLSFTIPDYSRRKK